MTETRITKGPYTAKPEPGMVIVANFGLGSFVMAPAGTKPGDPQATAESFARWANDATGDTARNSEIETAMALWEAVLDRRAAEQKSSEGDLTLSRQFEEQGFAEMRRLAANLIPACEAAWLEIKDDYTDAWDWEFLPIVVGLWIDADFEASAVTVEKIVAAAMSSEEG
jgi:hypothetical protein